MSKKPEVYSALSAACYIHSTQAAQKVPETKKVDDGVHSVRRGNLTKYMVLISSLLRSFHAGCSESAGDEEGRLWCTFLRQGNLMKYTVLISSLLCSSHAGCSESTGDEEGRRWRIFCTLKKPDVYSALSTACYVHSTQAAQKVPETKKVDEGVHSVRRGNLMKYTVLYQQPLR